MALEKNLKMWLTLDLGNNFMTSFRLLLTRLGSSAVLISLAVALVVAVMAAPLASKWGWWHFSAAFTALKLLFAIGVVISSVALLRMVYMLFKHRVEQAVPFALCILIAALPLGYMVYGVMQVKSLPFIHDITTDTDNPPLYTVAKMRRSASDNSTDYDPATSSQQLAAYPDVTPLYIESTVDITFERVATLLKQLDYQDIALDSKSLAIEFTETSFWFGFVDDVVIRFSREGQQTKIDIRSASRVGLSDIGKNAQRIGEISRHINALFNK
jgi:uncharacterized protein (DUF1499 family)